LVIDHERRSVSITIFTDR